MADLKKVHNDRLLLQFDNRESEKDREIDILTGYITQHFNVAGAKLKTVISKEKGNKLDPDSKIRKNIQRCETGFVSFAVKACGMGRARRYV